MALPSATKAEDEEKHHQLIEEAYNDLGVKYPKQDQHMLYRAAENLVKARANGILYDDIIRMDVREKPKDRRDYSVKVTFPSLVKPYLRDEILGALSEIVDPKDIIGAGPLQDNSKWIFTLRNRDAVVKVLKKNKQKNQKN